jgi:putative nucleotidyltransferase with HDIG domain
LENLLHWPTRRAFYLITLVVVTAVLTYFALVLPAYQQESILELRVGEVAPQDIVAPRPITYTSELRTQQARESASNNVLPVYSPPDTSIARKQLERLRATLAFITSVRADAFALTEKKMADLAALEDIHLNQETAAKILALSDPRWQTVQQETIVVLEQVMRTTIREDRLDETRRTVPALVSLSLPEEQAAIVAELVVGFVTPNSLFSESLTEAARQRAREAVKPVPRSYVAGETIVQRGRVITPLDLEALEQFGLVEPENHWRDQLGAGSLTLLTIVFIFLFLRNDSHLWHDLRGLTLIVVLFLVFLYAARLIIPGHSILPYLFPLTAFSLTVAALFGAQVSLVFTLPLAILYAYDLPNALDITLFFLLSGFLGVMTLGQARRVTSFIGAGLAIAISGVCVIGAFRLPDQTTDWIGLATLAGTATLNGIASASLTILLQFILAQFLGMTTALQLMELSRPDHPLLQFILRNAPGTYQHSLQVANLAEQAAERIGADPLLTRVGALYHDAGKAVNPFYFIENQVNNILNPHNSLDPVTSAAVIIRHVTDGLELAHKYHLPARLREFITEHHGTMLTRYQYVKAVEAADGDESQVDQSLFRYPGPRPRSRETAILMLADGSEARVRAERPKDEHELRTVIRSVIHQGISIGELVDTDLTLRDLDKIVDSFSTTLRGIYHPRIEYPKLEKAIAARSDPRPVEPTIPRPTVEPTLQQEPLPTTTVNPTSGRVE